MSESPTLVGEVRRFLVGLGMSPRDIDERELTRLRAWLDTPADKRPKRFILSPQAPDKGSKVKRR